MDRNRIRSKIALAGVLAGLLSALSWAGDIDPPGPPGPTMKPLNELEPRTALYQEMFPVTISAPGSYYLAQDVSASGGITIAASNVTIDLNGFRLAGNGGGSGIDVSGAQENIKILNGIVRGWGVSGVDLGGTDRVVVERVIASDNGGEGILAGTGAVIQNCLAGNNTGAGIWVWEHSVVRDSVAHDNGLATGQSGIFTGHSSLVESCAAHHNGYNGIVVGRDSVVTNSSASDNFQTGIDGTADNARVAGCVVSGNTFWGIAVGDGSVVRDCAVKENGTGIETGRGSHVETCTVLNNTGNGIMLDHGSTVRDCTVRENKSNGIYATYGDDVIGNNCTRNGSAAHAGGDGAGIYAEGADNRIDGNLVLSNDRGIEVALAGNVIVRNSASGNGDDYGSIVVGNALGPIGAAATATSPWANIQF